MKTEIIPSGFHDDVFVEKQYTENASSRSVAYAFLYKGEKCRHLVMDSKRSKKLAAYHLIFKDLDFVRASANCLLQNLAQAEQSGELMGSASLDSQTFVIAKSLHHSIVIMYGKCFAGASGGRSKGNKSGARGLKLEKGLTDAFPPEIRTCHQEIIKQRNEFIAHGGATELEKADTVIVLPANDEFVPNMFTREVHTGSMDADFYETVLRLIDLLQAEIRTKTDLIVKSIWKNEFSSFTKSELDELSVAVSSITVAS